MSALETKPQYETSKYFAKFRSALRKAGFIHVTKLSDTLQGVVLKAVRKENHQAVVIKVTNKYLHTMAMAYINGREYRNVKENIVHEASILRYITAQQDAPKSIVQYCDFLECATNYYLVMSDGGGSLFSFIKQAHGLISAGHLPVSEWHKAVKVIFVQMVECIAFLHSKRICHFDISLENILINDVQITCVEHKNAKHSKIAFNLNDIQIKLIDFGLATIFKAMGHYECNKFCGKKAYKSPENMARKAFNAKKNDIWCLGICLWMMLFGCGPWHKAAETDVLFNEIMNGGMADVLKSWRIPDINEDLIDLLQSLYQYQEKRMTLNEIKNHLWIKD